MINNEIGKELKGSELKPNTIVVIKPPGHNAMITMHVVEKRDNLVVFYSGVLNWHVINVIDNNNNLIDDQGRQVHVYKYLGEP